MDPITLITAVTPVVTKISGQLLDAYKQKTGSNYQRYVAELEQSSRAAQRVHEAARWAHEASESALSREHQRGEAATYREFMRAEASRQREHEIAKIWEQAKVELWSLAEQDSYEARKAIRPFSAPASDIAPMLRYASRDGRQPLLLFAPFSDESRSAAQSDAGPQGYRIGPRSSWAASSWAGDAEPVDGLFSRPLYRGYLDAYLVRSELEDLPVVLVNGQIQAGARLWLTLSTWGILGPGIGVRVEFPPMDLPSTDGLDTGAVRAVQLDIEDAVSAALMPVAAQLFEWFHLTRHGRMPRLHRTLPEGLRERRAIVAAGSLGGFLVAERDGVLSHLDAQLGSARVAIEGGLPKLAHDLIEEVGQTLGDQPELISDRAAMDLAALRAIARQTDLALTATVSELLETVARKLLQDLPGGGY